MSSQLGRGILFIAQSSSANLLEQGLELAGLGLQVRVAADMLLADVDVGDGALARDLDERGLDGGAVVNLVELDREVLGAHAV